MLCVLMELEEWGIRIVCFLIEKGVVLDCVDRYGMNVMYLLCIYGCVELVRIFFNVLDFDLIEVDKWGNIVFYYVVRVGSVFLVWFVVYVYKKYKIFMDWKNCDGLLVFEEVFWFFYGWCVEIIVVFERIVEEDVELLVFFFMLDFRFFKDMFSNCIVFECLMMWLWIVFVMCWNLMFSGSLMLSLYFV